MDSIKLEEKWYKESTYGQPQDWSDMTKTLSMDSLEPQDNWHKDYLWTAPSLKRCGIDPTYGQPQDLSDMTKTPPMDSLEPQDNWHKDYLWTAPSLKRNVIKTPPMDSPKRYDISTPHYGYKIYLLTISIILDGLNSSLKTLTESHLNETLVKKEIHIWWKQQSQNQTAANSKKLSEIGWHIQSHRKGRR